jgi:putative hemolysin
MIASASTEAYLRLMVARRLVRILTMLALLLAPLSMVGGHAAMALPVAAASAVHHDQASDQSAHCAEMGGETQEDDDTSPDDCLTDCAVACSAIPALGSAMADQPMAPAMARPLPLVGRVRGRHPESADPPPRIA